MLFFFLFYYPWLLFFIFSSENVGCFPRVVRVNTLSLEKCLIEVTYFLVVSSASICYFPRVVGVK